MDKSNCCTNSMMEGCGNCMAYEFQPENVSPFYDDYKDFATPQWPFISQLAFVCYRTVVAVLICVWVCIDLFEEGAKFYADNFAIWFIFATNWGFLILAISAIIQAVAATYYLFQSKQPEADRDNKSNAVPIMVLWILYNIAANCAMVVTISYWTFLTAFDTSGFLQTHMSQIKHTLNTAYIITDLWLSAMPIRIFHLIYPMFIGAIYTVFNALYFINDGMGPGGKPYAYYVMDWRNPIESAITCSLGFILTTVIQTILYAIYRFRVWVFKRYFERTKSELGISLTDYNKEGDEKMDGEREQTVVGKSKDVECGEPEERDIILPKSNGRPKYSSTMNTTEEIEMIDEDSPS